MTPAVTKTTFQLIPPLFFVPHVMLNGIGPFFPELEPIVVTTADSSVCVCVCVGGGGGGGEVSVGSVAVWRDGSGEGGCR